MRRVQRAMELLVQIDKPTKQVMIEARLVEVTANPKQSYGINWGGVLGGSNNPQTIKFAGSDPADPIGHYLVPLIAKIAPVPLAA